MKIEKVNLRPDNKRVNMTAYLLDESEEFTNIDKRPAVIIFPGGGYFTTSDREAEPIAMAYLAEGFNAVVVRYSVGKESSFEEALHDAENALSIIRKNAEAWQIDRNKLVAVGFSAGGHLAAALGTMGENRPNALILGYPCILDSIKLAFSIPSLDKKVDKRTPKTFIFSTFEDQVVPVNHSIQFMDALNAHQIPFESHIFQKGSHGLSLAKPFSSSGLKFMVDETFSQWFGMSVSWLHKVFDGFPADKESLIPNAENKKQYSIDIRIGSLLDNAKSRDILLEYLPGLNNEKRAEASKNYSLAMINHHMESPLSERQLIDLDNRLKKVPYTD